MGPLHNLLVEKEGKILFHIKCLKLYQFKRVTWWCLSVMEFVMEFALQSIFKFVMLEKYFEKVMVSWNLCQAHLLEVGLTKSLGDHETLSIVRHVGLHVDFSSMKSSLGL